MMVVSGYALAVVLAQPPMAPVPSPPVPVIVSPNAIQPGPRLVDIVPAPPPAPLPEPIPAARELAMRIVDRLGFLDKEAHRMVANQLQWAGNGGRCDYGNAECRRVAEEIAAREAPGMVAEIRSSLSRVIGAQFQRTMTVPQMEEASRFLGSAAGQALIGSFMAVDERTFAGAEATFSALRRRRSDLAAEFARRTQHLPRAAVPSPPMIAVPPPPAPPPPPRP